MSVVALHFSSLDALDPKIQMNPIRIVLSLDVVIQPHTAAFGFRARYTR